MLAAEDEENIFLRVTEGASNESRKLFAECIKPEREMTLSFTGSIELFYGSKQIGAFGFMIIDNVSYIRAIAIDKKMRKNGYGSFLLSTGVEFLIKEFPKNEVLLFADRFRVPWYKNRGFTLIDASVAKRKDWYSQKKEYRFNPVMKYIDPVYF